MSAILVFTSGKRKRPIYNTCPLLKVPETRKKIIELFNCWWLHQEVAYNEKMAYKANALLAQKVFQNGDHTWLHISWCNVGEVTSTLCQDSRSKLTVLSPKSKVLLSWVDKGENHAN
jgi:hypothetical protein